MLVDSQTVSITPVSLNANAVASHRLGAARPKSAMLFSIAFALILCTGAFLRFRQLDRQIFWCDEVFTAFAISGHTPDEWNRVFARVATRDEYMNLQRIKPGTTSLNVLSTIAHNFAEQGPIYYVLVREWTRFAGCTPVALRALSAVFGMLCLPALYMLFKQCFRDRLTAILAMGFIAMSPMWVYYSQEARPYTVWMFFAILSSLTFKTAARNNRRKDWLAYLAVTTLCWYLHLFSIFLVFSQFVLMAYFHLPQLPKCLTPNFWRRHIGKSDSPVVPFVTCNIVSASLFVPWFYLLLRHHTVSNWLEQRSTLMQSICTETKHIWQCFGYYSPESNIWVTAGKGLLINIVLLGLLAIIKNRKNIPFSLYFLILAAIPAVTFITLDTIFGWNFTSVVRYQLPYIIATPVLTAYAAALLIRNSNPIIRLGGGVAVACILALELHAIYICEQKSIDLTGSGWQANQAAAVVNTAHDPLIVSGHVAPLLVLSRLLKSDSRLLLCIGAKPDIPRSYNRFYLYKANPGLIAKLGGYRIHPSPCSQCLLIAERK